MTREGYIYIPPFGCAFVFGGAWGGMPFEEGGQFLKQLEVGIGFQPRGFQDMLFQMNLKS